MTHASNGQKIYTYDLMGRSQVHYVFTQQKQSNVSSTVKAMSNRNENSVESTNNNSDIDTSKSLTGKRSESQEAVEIDNERVQHHEDKFTMENTQDISETDMILLDFGGEASSAAFGAAQSPDDQTQRRSVSDPAQHFDLDTSPFSWASPLRVKPTSTPTLGFHEDHLIAQFQSEKSPFSREVFLRTGQLDTHDDQVTGGGREEAQGIEQVIEKDTSLTSNKELQGELHLSDSPSVHVPDRSVDQSNFSLGELSLSADDYLVDDSNLSEQASPGLVQMDQSIRSAIAGLGPKDPLPTLGSTEEVKSQVGETSGINTEDNDYPPRPSSQPESIQFLDDSFSSEVTEPEEKDIPDPPLALLMYSQPKVWTDEAGDPTGEDEDAVSINTEGGSEGGVMEETVVEDRRAEPSSAGLWMQDDLLQTMVPQRKNSQEVTETATSEASESSKYIDKPNNPSPAPSLDEERGPSISLEDISPERKERSASTTLDQSADSEREKSMNPSLSTPTTSGKFEDLPSPGLEPSPTGQKEKRRSLSRIPQTVRSSSVGAKRSSSLSRTSDKSLDERSPSPKDGANKGQQSKSESKATTSNKKYSSHQVPPKKPERKMSKKSKGSVDHSSSHSSNSSREELHKPAVSTHSVKSSTSKVDQLVQVKKQTSDSKTGKSPKTKDTHKDVKETVKRKEKESTKEMEIDRQNQDGGMGLIPSNPHQIDYQERPGTGGQNQYERSAAPQNLLEPKLMQTSHEKGPPHQQNIIDNNRQPSHSKTVTDQYQYQNQNQMATQQARLAQLHQTRMMLLDQEQGQKEHIPGPGMTRKIYSHQQAYPGQGSVQYNSRAHDASLSGPPDMMMGKMRPTRTVDELLNDVGFDVHSMEQVRIHLQNVLKDTSQIIPVEKVPHDQDAHMQSLLSSFQDDKDASIASSTAFPGYTHKTLVDLTSQMENLTSHSPVSDVVYSGGRSDATVGLENQLLRENIEKEIYKRKHCEKQIHLLQSKLLEVQQQLAVAVNTDRKKDTMIEQLDKALAKVVDGWKSRESERVEVINRLQAENHLLSAKSEAQTQLIQKFEAEMSNIVDQLTASKKSEEMALYDRDYKLAVKDRERLEAIEAMEIQREQYNTLSTNHEHSLHQTEKVRNELIKIQGTLENERDTWEEKEREYLQKIDEITDNHLTTIEQEKSKCEQQAQLLRETHEVLAASQSESQQLHQQLDSTSREKESLHVQLGLLEDKMESSLRTLEADLRCEAEKALSSKLDEAHRRQRANEEELHERLRRQVHELSQRHTTELKEVHRQHQDDLRHKDEILTQKVMEFEEMIKEGRSELESIQAYVKQLESQRQEMTSRLQMMMQTHWEEALHVLTGTPSSNNNIMSQLSGYQRAMSESQESGPGPALMSDEKMIQSDTGHMTSSLQPTDTIRANEYGFQGSGKQIAGPHVAGYSDKAFSALEPEQLSPQKDEELPQQPNTTSTSTTSLQQHHSYSHATQDIYKPHHQQQQHPQTGPYPTTHPHHHPHSSHQPPHPYQHPIQMNIPGFSLQSESNAGRHPTSASEEHPAHYGTNTTHYTTAHSQPHHNDNTSNMSTSSQQPVMTSARTVVTRLEPSFLETLTNEAERAHYHASQNSSMMSDEGCVPLPQDTSVSTLNDDLGYQNMTGISMGRLTDISAFTHRLSDIPERSHQRAPQDKHELDSSNMSERSQLPEDRRKELERFMKILLNRSPGHPIPENETRTAEHALDESYLSATHGQPPAVELGGVGQLPPGVAFNKTTVGPNQGGRAHVQDGSPAGPISPTQVGEITRLLGMYRSRAAAADSAIQQQQIQHEQQHPSERGVPSSAGQSRQHTSRDVVPGQEMPTRQPALAETQVIKVPTGGAEGSSPKRSTSPGKQSSGSTGPTASTKSGPQRGNPQPNKVEKKSDKQQKPRAKIWK